jgi:predicted DNA-binding transcriptional regulator AlpA
MNPGRDKLQDQLAYPPRAMRADRAAAYLAMATSTFLELVKEGLLPKGVKVKGMRCGIGTTWTALLMN